MSLLLLFDNQGGGGAAPTVVRSRLPILGVGILAALILVVSAGASALRPSITVASNTGNQATFDITLSGHEKRNERYLLWVANKCYAAGELVSAEYLPVRWPEGQAGVFVTSGDSCTAYVWRFPGSEDPIRGAEVTYGPVA